MTSKEEEKDWIYDTISRSGSRMRINEIDKDNLPPMTPTSDVFLHESPINSDHSSDSLPKKRRSYEKSYRTHEPLEGVEEIPFDEKQWELDSPLGSDFDRNSKQNGDMHFSSEPEYTEPFLNTSPPLERKSAYLHDDRVSPDVVASTRSASDPNMLDDNHALYSEINKNNSKVNDADRRRIQSQSSVITDV